MINEQQETDRQFIWRSYTRPNVFFMLRDDIEFEVRYNNGKFEPQPVKKTTVIGHYKTQSVIEIKLRESEIDYLKKLKNEL